MARNTGSLWSTDEFRPDRLDGPKLGGGVTFSDASSAEFEGINSTPGYGTVELMAAYGWYLGKSRISLPFDVYNLLDIRYCKDASASGASTRAPHRNAAQFSPRPPHRVLRGGQPATWRICELRLCDFTHPRQPQQALKKPVAPPMLVRMGMACILLTIGLHDLNWAGGRARWKAAVARAARRFFSLV